MTFFKSRKVLLVNFTNEPMHFIAIKKAIRLIVKNKADVITVWNNIIITYQNGKIDCPSILKMKYYVNFRRKSIRYSKYAVFYRDRFNCQYCGLKVNQKNITLDHIHPKSLGGKSTFDNCVTSCIGCNKKKGNKELGSIGMSLLKQPIKPATYVYNINPNDIWFNEWDSYIP